MIEVHPDRGAQGRKEDVGDIGMAVFRDRSSGFDDRPGDGGEEGGRQVRKGPLRVRPCVLDDNSDRKPCSRRLQ
jgi:hypothetical protein